MLRKTADVRTLAYLAFTAGLSIVQWRIGHLVWPLYVLSLLMAVSVAVISHNHNHISIWKSKPLNLLTSYIISLYYGHPAIAWVPTHNQIHHKLNNKEGDSSRSPKIFKGNHLLSLLVYPTATGIVQQQDIKAFFRDLYKRNRKAWYMAISEYVVFFGVMAGLFLLDWRKALLYFFIPQQFALFVIQVFNYVQHVEADAESPWNHSRNFVSPLLNAFLFNNGYHTVHHMTPGLHWSVTPEAHEKVKDKIHPALNEPSYFGYMFKTFLLRPFTGSRAPDLRGTAAKPMPDLTPAAAE